VSRCGRALRKRRRYETERGEPRLEAIENESMPATKRTVITSSTMGCEILSSMSILGRSVMLRRPRRARAAMYPQPVPIGMLLVRTILILFPLSGEVSVAATHPAISPNQDFSNPILQIRAPRSNGWYGLEQSPTRIAFAKSGSNADESFVAEVFLLRIPTFPNSEAFTEYVREGIIKDSPSDRFEVIDLNVQYSPEREYPCVRYHGISNDRKARTSALGRKELRIEVIALYCEHPSKPGLAFYVSFSHRGGSADEKIDDDAAAFIESVQVTLPRKTP
jgi:hypothetical protein